MKSKSIASGMIPQFWSIFSWKGNFPEQSWEGKLGLAYGGLGQYPHHCFASVNPAINPGQIGGLSVRVKHYPTPLATAVLAGSVSKMLFDMFLRGCRCGSSLTPLRWAPLRCQLPLSPGFMLNGQHQGAPVCRSVTQQGPAGRAPWASSWAGHLIAAFSALPEHSSTNAFLFQSHFAPKTCLRFNSISQIPFMWTTRLSPRAQARKKNGLWLEKGLFSDQIFQFSQEPIWDCSLTALGENQIPRDNLLAKPSAFSASAFIPVTLESSIDHFDFHLHATMRKTFEGLRWEQKDLWWSLKKNFLIKTPTDACYDAHLTP